MATILGAKIKHLRKKKELTLEQLGKLTESSKSYIWELENSPTPPRPSVEKLSKIAVQLDVTLEYLADFEEKISEEDATDKMFYRKYLQLETPVKEKIKKMIELWDDE